MSTNKKDKSTTLHLDIPDRISIPGMLPQQGGLAEQIIAKDIRKKVEFSQEDLKKFEIQDIVHPEGRTGIRWNPLKDKPVAITFTDDEVRLMARSIDRLDKEKKINPENIETVLKFKNA